MNEEKKKEWLELLPIDGTVFSARGKSLIARIEDIAVALFGFLCLCLACNSSAQNDAKKPFDKATIIEIIPLVDGGAYEQSGDSIWYLKGAEAVRVQEVTELSAKPVSLNSTKREKFYFALWQRLESKRRFDQQAEQPEEPPDHY